MSKKALKPFTRKKKCHWCKGTGTWGVYDGDGKRVGTQPCGACNGKKKYPYSVPHPSHKMTKWGSEVLAPCGTARFYMIRRCTSCGLEEWKHAAGHFLHELDYPCEPNDDC